MSALVGDGINEVFKLGCEFVGKPLRDCEGLEDFVVIIKDSLFKGWLNEGLRCW